MKADLHSHSIYSDGTLTPAEVVDLAVANNVELFALTDHDSIQGLQEARARCEMHDLTMINGVEVSVTWCGYTIHIVGLNIDVDHMAINDILDENAKCRRVRIQQMIDKLDHLNINLDSFLADTIPENGLITRTHLARGLIATGKVKKMDQAFKKYLGKGKPAYVDGDWVSLKKAVQAINDSGGTAIIAHPMRYRLSATRLDKLVHDFTEVGGTGLEVVTATQDVNQQARCAQLVKQYDLHASIGSDFHSLDQPWSMIGKCANLPSSVKPIWQCW